MCLDRAGVSQLWDPESGLAVGPPLKQDLAPGILSVAPDGRLLAVSGMHGPRGRVVMWNQPVPEGTPERLACWVAVRTGRRVDARGVVQPIEAEERDRLQDQLTALGGPPPR